MCNLIFKYNESRINAENEITPPVFESLKNDIEEKYNKRYKRFCERINNEGGYIRVSTSLDGSTLVSAELINCSDEVYKDIRRGSMH